MRTDEEIFALMETLGKVCAKRYGAWSARNYPNLYVSIGILSVLEDILEKRWMKSPEHCITPENEKEEMD